jgi:hypothetical protein
MSVPRPRGRSDSPHRRAATGIRVRDEPLCSLGSFHKGDYYLNNHLPSYLNSVARVGYPQTDKEEENSDDGTLATSNLGGDQQIMAGTGSHLQAGINFIDLTKDDEEKVVPVKSDVQAKSTVQVETGDNFVDLTLDE